jgi:hypothetical protein
LICRERGKKMPADVGASSAKRERRRPAWSAFASYHRAQNLVTEASVAAPTFPAFVIGIKFYRTLLQNLADINRGYRFAPLNAGNRYC